jgi:hypothetical protein
MWVSDLTEISVSSTLSLPFPLISGDEEAHINNTRIEVRKCFLLQNSLISSSLCNHCLYNTNFILVMGTRSYSCVWLLGEIIRYCRNTLSKMKIRTKQEVVGKLMTSAFLQILYSVC